MKNEERGAVVLLSGGLDSYTAAAMLKADGFRLHALSIRYGQRHVRELESARRVASSLGAKAHLELAVDLARVGGSALTSDIAVPKDRAIDSSIPVTYVPARNTVFLSLALAWAEALGDLRHRHRRQRARLLGLSRLPAGIPAGLRVDGQPGDEGRR